MKKKLVKINAKNVSSKFGYIVEEYEDAALIKVGCKVDHMKALESENCIILGSELYEEVEADTTADILENLAETMKCDAITAAWRMNEQAAKKDQNRNRVNYGILAQALQYLRKLGYDTKNATWDDGGFLICEKITIDGKVVFER